MLRLLFSLVILTHAAGASPYLRNDREGASTRLDAGDRREITRLMGRTPPALSGVLKSGTCTKPLIAGPSFTLINR